MKHRSTIGIVGALALALTMAVPVSAATTTVSVTVQSSISMTGVPASIAFGTLAPGQTAMSTLFTIEVTSNAPFTVKASGTDLVSTPSGSDIPVTQLRLGSTTNPAVFENVNLTSTPANIVGGSGSLTSIPQAVRLHVPANQAAASYAGTITWTAATN